VSYVGAVLSVQPKLHGLGNVIIRFELRRDAAGDTYFACRIMPPLCCDVDTWKYSSVFLSLRMTYEVRNSVGIPHIAPEVWRIIAHVMVGMLTVAFG